MLLKQYIYSDKPLPPTYKINYVNMRDDDVNKWLDYVNSEHIFVCMGFFVPIENFSLIWRRHHDRSERMQNLTYARHLWPFSSDGSLAFKTYFDTGHPFIMVIFKDR